MTGQNKAVNYALKYFQPDISIFRANRKHTRNQKGNEKQIEPKRKKTSKKTRKQYL